MYSCVYRLDIILIDSLRLSGVWTTEDLGVMTRSNPCRKMTGVSLLRLLHELRVVILKKHPE